MNNHFAPGRSMKFKNTTKHQYFPCGYLGLGRVSCKSKNLPFLFLFQRKNSEYTKPSRLFHIRAWKHLHCCGIFRYTETLQGKEKKSIVCFCSGRFNLLEGSELGAELHVQCNAEYHKRGLERCTGIFWTKTIWAEKTNSFAEQWPVGFPVL